MSNRIRYSVVAVAAASLVLAGCSNGQRDSDSRTDTATSAAVSSSTTQTSSSTAASSSELQFADAYVKAKPADKSMTGIFGTIKNETKEEVTLTGFEADIDGASFEIHEVVAGKMQKKEGGITIPAGGSHELKPGADHLMVMNYDKPIQAGEDVDVKLMFSNGTTVEVPLLRAKKTTAPMVAWKGTTAYRKHRHPMLSTITITITTISHLSTPALPHSPQQ